MTEQELMEAIHKFFADKSRSAFETRAGLENASSEIEILLDSLPGEE